MSYSDTYFKSKTNMFTVHYLLYIYTHTCMYVHVTFSDIMIHLLEGCMKGLYIYR